MAKKLVSFDTDSDIGKKTKPSVFDRIVREIDATQIPPRYVQTVVVQYQDGSVVELEGHELNQSIPTGRNADKIEGIFKKMKDIKVYLDTETLEEDVNEMLELLMGRYC
jgi:hypothetical protein